MIMPHCNRFIFDYTQLTFYFKLRNVKSSLFKGEKFAEYVNEYG